MVAQWLWTLTRSPVVRYRGTGQLVCLKGAKNEIKQTDGTKGVTKGTKGNKSSKLVKESETEGPANVRLSTTNNRVKSQDQGYLRTAGTIHLSCDT